MIKQKIKSLFGIGGTPLDGILLEQYKAIYFPIPKVACSSLKKWCMDMLDIEKPEGADIHDIPLPKASMFQINSGAGKYYRFCFVRNPWDRVLSCYTNKIRKEKVTDRWLEEGVARNLVKYEKFHAGMDFDTFVEAILSIPDNEADRHFRSQNTFIEDNKGNLLADHIGKFENLVQGMTEISERLSIDDIQLPHLMKSNHSRYQKYYSDRSIAMVRERYQRDIDLFGYDFD